MPVAAVDVLNGFPFDGGEDLGVDDEVDETPLLPPSDGLQPQPVGVITGCYPLFGVTIRAVGRAVTATIAFDFFCCFTLSPAHLSATLLAAANHAETPSHARRGRWEP